jgi:hypothetical protein
MVLAAKNSDLVEIANAIPPQSSSFSLKTMKFRYESYMGTGLVYHYFIEFKRSAGVALLIFIDQTGSTDKLW